MWPPRVVRRIRLLANPLIPIVPIAVERTDAVAVDVNVVSAHNQRRRLVLVAHWQRMVQPVHNIRTPLVRR